MCISPLMQVGFTLPEAIRIRKYLAGEVHAAASSKSSGSAQVLKRTHSQAAVSKAENAKADLVKLHYESEKLPLLFPKTVYSRIHLQLTGSIPRCRQGSMEAFAADCVSRTGLDFVAEVKPSRGFCDLCFEHLDDDTKNRIIAAIEMQSDT